ncbi:MAG: bifunctional [glutamate--ammonia ligase]-adenylyl-L-tyrosine phosphorylase/[glutamate--ammonia-ligase] adenylyltransferase [Pseudomonadales bacterium]
MHNSPLPLTALPELLAADVEKYKQQFIERNPDYNDWFSRRLTDNDFRLQLARTWAGSQYAAELCCRQPQVFQQLVNSNELQRDYAANEIEERLTALLSAVSDEEQLNQQLRQFRAQQMLRIIWRDLNRLGDLQDTTRDVSALAQASIRQALDFFHQQLCESYGRPTAVIDGNALEQKMIVLGMGKLGAWELNVSSDIDLIFCYPCSGETVGSEAIVSKKRVSKKRLGKNSGENRVGKKPLDNGEFFTRLACKLINSLDQRTADGFVFRVDMRLRPYGQSGALVLSFDAMEEYYQSQGRDWERYAMIKARVVAGDPGQGQQLMDLLRPFTYRRYIDFSAIESLRSMKKMIRQEVKRRRLHNDIKLGVGGIREIEFIAQCFQLIRGGRDIDLQERRVQAVLWLLEEKNYMPQQAVAELQQAYIFLRNTEHAIQAFNDQQTQLLPDDDHPKIALAFSMGFTSWNGFFSALSEHRKKVDYHFCEIISDAHEKNDSGAVAAHWKDIWFNAFDDEAGKKILLDAGHEKADEVLNRITHLREDGIVLRMQVVGRERLDQFMPLLLQATERAEQPSAALLRIFPLVESVLRRTAYLILLVENPGALQQLVILCAASPWIAVQLAKYPVLLDELLDARTLYQVPEKEALRAELQQQMLRLPWDDLDAHMEALRYFKQAHQLHVSAAEVTSKLPLMKVSDYLTMIAEVVLEHVLELAWYNLTEKHGRPQKAEGVPCDKDFIVVGYGKLGGIELGHSSDLDLVFLHDAAAGLSTDGERPIDNSLFFTRLGQRMIHILTTQTPSGMLYEVDMRLRPSGTSGLLVSSLKAFKIYQKQHAWTWEQQALVRARVVAGDRALQKFFEALRLELLCEPRDCEGLKEDVREMRLKMRDHMLPKGLEQAENPIFHLKHGSGAIVDIEFMVQYAVLAWSHQHPALAVYTDNIRILESLQQAGLFSNADAEALTDAYKAYRAHAHRLSLLQQPSEVPMAKFDYHRRTVVAKWLELIGWN